MIISRELRMFHEENRTHVSKKEFNGTELNIDNAVNAPMDLKIYGASYQAVTVQGKNLLDKERYVSIPDGATTVVGFDLSLLELGKTYTFYISKPCTFTKISDSHGGYNCAINWKNGESFTSWTFTHTRNQNVPAGKKLNLFIGFNSMNFSTDIGDFEGADIQIEEGSALTEYEPFVPDSPSADYPSEIYPSSEILLKCSNGTKTNSTKIPLVGNAIEVSDFANSNLTVDGKFYCADYIEYNSATNKALRYKFVDDTALDRTRPIKDQTQAIRTVAIIEELTPTETEYVFNSVKSIQDGCIINTECYSEDVAYPLPLQLNAKVKVIK